MTPQPRYPIYVPSKGRPDRKLSCVVSLLEASGVEFKIVVEWPDFEPYAEVYGADSLLVISERDKGIAATRNFIAEHAERSGAARHWQIDDNVKSFFKLNRKLVKCDPAVALGTVEDFVDRFENVAAAGLRSSAFGWGAQKPFVVNQSVYCCMLIASGYPYRFRGRVLEDCDYALQVLSGGHCTIQFSVFQIEKTISGKMSGGNTDDLYAGDGRVERSRWLEAAWPGLVKTSRRWGRPTHTLGHVWKHFTTPLKPKER